MTRKEFLKRCETIWDAGLFSDDRAKLLDRWLDFVLRFDGVFFSHNPQGPYLFDFMESERNRIMKNDGKTLASDDDGYALIQMSAILAHPCQKCAEDTKAWWTRVAFCEHKKGSVTK